MPSKSKNTFPAAQLMLFHENGDPILRPNAGVKAKEKTRQGKKQRAKEEADVTRPKNTLLAAPPAGIRGFAKELAEFKEFGTATICRQLEFTASGKSYAVPIFVNEYWTSKQRAAHSLQEVSYRACFKPQLPHFFIQRLTQPGDVVYDPFMGRGTTLLEAAFMGRVPWGSDANPLSLALLDSRLNPPTESELDKRLDSLDLTKAKSPLWEDLLVFYERSTLTEITALRDYFLARQAAGTLDNVDQFIRMVAINRLTGHSPGFFSVYSLPPNQAVSIASQTRINAQRNQVPPYRNVKNIIKKKGKNLLKDLTREERETLAKVAPKANTWQAFAHEKTLGKKGSVDLVVTSPPFLDVVQYSVDNWLRCWFIGVDSESLNLTMPSKLSLWTDLMRQSLSQLFHLVKPGGHVAFEVGEVKGGYPLDEVIAPVGAEVGFVPELVLINAQEFTKTSNCWGVDNQAAGTNTNRIVLFKKP